MSKSSDLYITTVHCILSRITVFLILYGSLKTNIQSCTDKKLLITIVGLKEVEKVTHILHLEIRNKSPRMFELFHEISSYITLMPSNRNLK